MFCACGIDLYQDPCPVVILDKTGVVLEWTHLTRNPSILSNYFKDFSHEQGNILFCSLTYESTRNFPEFVEPLRDAGMLIKTYTLYDMLHMKDMLRDLRTELPIAAYCLAKMVQNEALDHCTYSKELEEIYKLRESLDRLLLSLSTRCAFPDDHHLMRFK